MKTTLKTQGTNNAPRLIRATEPRQPVKVAARPFPVRVTSPVRVPTPGPA